MQNESLEKELRGRLYDYESPTDPEMIWANVEGQLQTRRKRPGAIWWWLPGLLLVGVIGWYAWASLAETPSAESTATALATTATEQEVKSVSASTLSPEMPAAEEAKVQLNAAATTNASTPTPEKQLSASSKSIRPTPITSQSSTQVAPVAANQLNSEDAPLQEPSTLMLVTSAPEPEPAPNVAAANLVVDRLAVYLPTPLPTTFYDPETPPFSELKDPACPVFTKRNKPSWSIGVTGGIALPVREIIAPNPDNPGQRLRNLEVEEPLNAVSAQFLVGFETGNGFSLRSGLGYQRINSLAEYTVDTVITTVSTGISEIIINGPGDTTFITGLVERRTHTSGTSRYYNNLTTVDLPILLGKTFRAGKWRFGVEAGPVLNLRTSGSARYQLPDGTFSTRADNDGLFRSRLTGLGWQGSLYTSFALRPKLDVSLGLRGFRQQRGGFEVDGAATKTTYNTYGVQLGIKQRF